MYLINGLFSVACITLNIISSGIFISKSGLITARKTDEAGNYKLIDPLTNKEKIPPAVTPPKTYSEIISQNPLSIRRNTLMQEYLKKQQEKKKNISSMGD